ncbi:MBL fold metallo-hydrolase [Evansella tamaricis]|uniref:MBL fold metallo-hydrolase n=1 Tax=Evansella tamaricis TaxID=2069301 RepID=A0ABS6JHK0_9BACI|nr:MBL fold metallo-hydrolase [Evansella tamaricis]MBU9713066.1 MBL fold metallo-hydrolase [Evansella tamaricis]
MKIKKISENVWKLSIWMILPMSVWIVREEDGVTLIDCGLKSMTNRILKFIDSLNAGPLKRILLTHGHSDHIGALQGILEKKSVNVYVHGLEIPYMEGELPYPGRKKATKVVMDGVLKALEESDNKMEIIGDLVPYHTPGHSPGHVAYYHAKDNILISGDLFTSNSNGINRPIPMFTADMKQAIISGKIVKELKPKLVSVCHGMDVSEPDKQYDAYATKWLKMNEKKGALM